MPTYPQRVFGSRLAVAITSVIVTAVVLMGGMALANVPNNSVTSAKIRNGAVKNIDIRNGTIRSVDIHNGTIQQQDLAAGARPTLAKSETNPGASSVHAHGASCPAGKHAVAGGGSTSESDTFMTDSYPQIPSIWYVRWETDNNTTVDPSFVRVWALCLPGTIIQ